MVRERPHDSDEDQPRGSRHRRHDNFEDEDQPEYDYEKRPKRGKSEKKSGARLASDDEPDEDGAEDSRYQQQLVVREKPKKAKSSRKQTALKKRDGSSESSTEASEEEPKREKEKEKRKKRKSKFDEDETIMVRKWEVVHPDEVDEDFVDRLVGVLGHHPLKIHGWIEENLLRRHTQTGEYDIDLMFERGVLARADKKKWEGYLKKAQRNPQLSQALYNLFKARRVVFDAMRVSMGSTGRRGDSAGFVPHLNVNYDPRCPDCRACGESCLLA